MTITIALFKNEGKDPDSNQPDFHGWNSKTCDSAAGWTKIAENGTEYISLRIETKADKEKRFKELKNMMG